MREFLTELRERWDDKYFWLDHPELRVAIIATISGAIGLLFLWAQLEMRARYARRVEVEPLAA